MNNYEPQTPVLTTTEVSYISQTTAISGGNITSDGGLTITARGVCWSTGLTPTIDDNKTVDWIGAGSFISVILGLTVGETYYVRAYATNRAGTSYGCIMAFKTVEDVTDVEGNVYHTVTIGTQTWMVENLKTTRFRNLEGLGDRYNYHSQDSHGAPLETFYSYFEDYKYKSYKTFGRLYNWNAVNDPRGLAPSGWHIPTDAEWTTLITYLGGASTAGGKLKEAGTAHWASPNTGATNETGFTALPSGYWLSGGFICIYTDCGWWSTTECDSATAWCWHLSYGSSNIDRANRSKEFCYPIRCVKD
jgi:uncharacterized protein (TIGR02145 family)